jgi:hypothetical protein
MDHKISQRLLWVEIFEKTGDASLVRRRYGISRLGSDYGSHVITSMGRTV